MKKLTVLFASALLALVLVTPASALGPAVWEWDFDYNAAIVDYENQWGFQDGITESMPTDLVYPGSGPEDVNAPQALTWGPNDEDYGESSITLDPINEGDVGYDTIKTNGPLSPVLNWSHDNQIIVGSYVAWGQVRSTFQLTPNPPDGFVSETFMANLEFHFYETPNSVPASWDEGTQGTWSSSDIFLFDAANSDDPFGSFEYNGYTYDYNFLGSYQVLDHLYIEQLNSALGLGLPTGGDEVYIGWITPEETLSTFTGLVEVTTVVPEPSTFILLGAGLLGLVGVARRRRS